MPNTHTRLRRLKSMSLSALPTVDHSEPYTSPDEDPFSVHSHLQEAQEKLYKTRRTSLLARWIREPPQPGYATLGLGSSSNPYLAYPELPRLPWDDGASLQSYDLIEDDDIPFAASPSPPPSSPRPKLFPLFPRTPRSPSMSSVAVSDLPPRPSFCSEDIFSSSNATTTTLDSGVALSPPKPSFFSSLRLRPNRSSVTVSSVPSPRRIFSVKPNPTTLSSPISPMAASVLANVHDDPEDDLDDHPPSRLFFKQAETSRPTTTKSPNKLKRYKFASLTSRSAKKKKLVISGIGVTERRRFEGMKRWCESFGEIKSITRMPNGDLQVDFRDPEVADTVCRLRAKVFISGVGSVQLSWIIGNKR